MSEAGRARREAAVQTLRAVALLAGVLLAAALAGCSVMDTRPLDPALFPPPARQAEAPEPARVIVASSQPAQEYTSPALVYRAARVQLPIGAIVQAAAQLALGEQFEAVVAGPSAGPGLQVLISSVVAQHSSRLIYFVPVPFGVIDRVDVTSRLLFTVSVLAADGSARWSREYDTGPHLVRPQGDGFFRPESLQSSMQRTLHEQAVELMRLAAADLRLWLAQERRRDRVL